MAQFGPPYDFPGFQDSSSDSEVLGSGEVDESPVADHNLIEEVQASSSPPPAGDREMQEENIIHARAYQLEMFQESLKQNVIVVMDTGSGKTQVAVLRIQAELGRSPAGKLIWFLAPTVALCDQQKGVLAMQMSGACIKSLNGNDGVDTWSDQTTWDTFLKNVDIVVSTYQVLYDALAHRFVQMQSLSLIVFDEAHNCTGKHPGREIMSIYRTDQDSGLPVPSILGLTASPVMSLSSTALDEIEKTLDAVCKTPTIHRTELLSLANRPVMSCVAYSPTVDPKSPEIYTRSMQSLEQVRCSLDIRQDPFVLRKMNENTERSRLELRKAVMNHDTYVFGQIKSLCRKSVELRCELGSWAADYFLSTSITQYLDSCERNDKWYAAWDIAEKNFLAASLRRVDLHFPPFADDTQISSKAARLIEILLDCEPDTLGIVFVKQTATVYVLKQMLAVYPFTCERFRVGSMVGTSRFPQRKRDVGELSKGDGVLDLERFRSGSLDILIATSVLEEGIDVPACNLVICFDKPSDLKSFIQRRGRARMKKSRLILLHDEQKDQPSRWEDLEDVMRKQYEEEERERKSYDELEEAEEGSIAPFYTKLGARLTVENATSHLEHFCALLSARQYVEWKPYYVTQVLDDVVSETEPPLIRATVVLPNCVPPGLRRVESANAWYSEKKACKDAAFQAYIKLYEAELVNENLMPLQDDDLVPGVEPRPPMTEVRERWDPWQGIAKLWPNSKVYRCPVRILDQDRVLCEFHLSLPVPVPRIPATDVFWGPTAWKIAFGEPTESTQTTAGDDSDTMALIALAYGHRIAIKEGGSHVVRIHSTQGRISKDHIGGQEFRLDMVDKLGGTLPYLIRNIANGAPYFFDHWMPAKPPVDEIQKSTAYRDHLLEGYRTDGPWLSLKKWPRGRDFLHRPSDNSQPPTQGKRLSNSAWPESVCRVDSTPIVNVQFGSLIPSITHLVEIHLVARELSDTILQELDIQDLALLVTAISASSAEETTNYQQFEFLGDSVLKLLATVAVVVNHPNYPEGYLHMKRTGMVTNAKLCQCTQRAGLDEFIISKKFTGQKWQPTYVDELLETQDERPKRVISTKTLADVIESLVGASLVDGGEARGMDQAMKCLKILMPDMQWHSLNSGRLALYSMRTPSTELPAMLVPLERLLGYTFSDKSLLVEAVTHASYCNATSTSGSLERLEFLGDAILDAVVVSELWAARDPPLPHRIMSLMRAASVNADLLGFLAMEWTVEQETSEIIVVAPDADDSDSDSDSYHQQGAPLRVRPRVTSIPFWKFMRHASLEIGAVQRAATERHAQERGAILEAMQLSSSSSSSCRTYPWARLAHLDTPKFFSDMFESVLGAVWIDSGSLAACARVAERAGVLPYLRRLLTGGGDGTDGGCGGVVDVQHPKNKLGELVGSRTVRYECRRDTEGTAWWLCKVCVDDEVLVEVGEGLNKNEIITKAAERACEVWEQRVEKPTDGMDLDVLEART